MAHTRETIAYFIPSMNGVPQPVTYGAVFFNAVNFQRVAWQQEAEMDHCNNEQ
jgi:hypothetical protein